MLPTMHIRRYRLFPLLIIIVLVLATLATLLTDVRETQITHAAPPCASAPAGFDPTTATNATLAKYGFPLRMTTNPKSSAYQSWLKLAKSVKHHVCSTSTAYSHSTRKSAQITTKGTKSVQTMFADFTGYSVTSAHLFDIVGSWEVPCPSSGNNKGAVISTVELFSGTQPILSVGISQTHNTSSADTNQFAIQRGSLINYADTKQNPISCGDAANASITYVQNDPLGAISGPVWYGWVGDAVTGSAFANSTAASNNSGIAYWGEAGGHHSNATSLNPLYNFGLVRWQGVQVDTQGQGPSPLGNAAYDTSVMGNSGAQTLASPGSLIDSSTFVINWVQAY